MSMTQIAFLRKATIPTNAQIQDTIQQLGYDFKILRGLEEQIDRDGLACSLNGKQTYFETFVDDAGHIISENEAEWIEPDLTNQETAISFVWGGDFVAGACIGLVSVALIELSNALVYYMDDEMRYTKEMLLVEMPQYMEELNKQSKEKEDIQEIAMVSQANTHSEKTFWDRFKKIFN